MCENIVNEIENTTNNEYGIEVFNTFDDLLHYCRIRYPEHWQEVIDDTELWENLNGKFRLYRTEADKKFMNEDEFNELYWANGESWKDDINQPTHEIWTTEQQ